MAEFWLLSVSITGNLLKVFSPIGTLGSLTLPHGRPLALLYHCLVYLIGMVIIWFAPETRGKPLPD
jgi:hypothetical protein